MRLLDMEGKTNFFEKRVGEYQKAGVMNKEESSAPKFSLDEDF
jgi:ribonucleoside-diphosphate reductase beta chain